MAGLFGSACRDRIAYCQWQKFKYSVEAKTSLAKARQPNRAPTIKAPRTRPLTATPKETSTKPSPLRTLGWKTIHGGKSTLRRRSPSTRLLSGIGRTADYEDAWPGLAFKFSMNHARCFGKKQSSILRRATE